MRDEWQRVDAWFCDRLLPVDDALAAALAASTAAGLPAIAVAPNQGRWLELQARAIAARRILEIGTLGGYSAIWLARALPAGGRLVTLESEARHAEVARANLARAGLADRVDVRVGLAADTLPALHAERPDPFDLVFIDADKASVPLYFDWALRLARPGAVIIVDNVVREGEVTNAASTDASVRGVRALFDRLAADSRIRATALQTVGVKDWDGFLVALVPGPGA